MRLLYTFFIILIIVIVIIITIFIVLSLLQLHSVETMTSTAASTAETQRLSTGNAQDPTTVATCRDGYIFFSLIKFIRFITGYTC